jgi:transcriptional regulator with XRE-family HTH domain
MHGRAGEPCCYNALGVRTLRDWRRLRGLNQDDLARASGVSVDTVRAVEAGRRRAVRPHTMRVLAEALGVAIGDVAEFAPPGGAAAAEAD